MDTPRDIRIRPVAQPDFEAIAHIYNESIAKGGITMDTEPKQAKDIRSIVQKLGNREVLLVAVLAAEVVGWGIVRKYSDRPGYQVCCETSVYLSSRQIGKGYGKALQTALMAQVATYGYHHIVAKIIANNQASIQFHQQFGFSPVGIQKEIGLIENQWYDVLIMQCLLPRD